MNRREWNTKYILSDLNNGGYDYSNVEGQRFWVAGREFGRNAVARMGRSVEPSEVVVVIEKSKYAWGSPSGKFKKISKKTGNPLSSEISVNGKVHIFETEEEAVLYWERTNNELAMASLDEAAKVAEEYIKAFEKYNEASGQFKMNREDAIAIMKIL